MILFLVIIYKQNKKYNQNQKIKQTFLFVLVNSLLKYLGTYCKNYEYQAIYAYLYGIDTSKSKNVDIISLNQAIDKDIEVIFRKNGVGSLSEFEAKINLMKEEVNKEIMGEKLNFGGVHYHSTSGHIYNTDLKAARKLIKSNK